MELSKEQVVSLICIAEVEEAVKEFNCESVATSLDAMMENGDFKDLEAEFWEDVEILYDKGLLIGEPYDDAIGGGIVVEGLSASGWEYVRKLDKNEKLCEEIKKDVSLVERIKKFAISLDNNIGKLMESNSYKLLKDILGKN